MTQPAIHLTPAEHGRVSAAVAAAESASAGEIVTIVTDRSDSYADIALAWAALVAMTALTVLSLFPAFYLGLYDRVLGDWGREWTAQGIFTLAATVAILKFIGMVLLQLWQPLKFWLLPGSITAARVRARAEACEGAALAVDGVTNSEGAGASWGRTRVALATSLGFAGEYAGTSQSVSVSVLAGEGTGMERDDDFLSARHGADLGDPEATGRNAAMKALKRLNPRNQTAVSMMV